MTKILFVCHGNICRSPMAESIMSYLAGEAGAVLDVESAATSYEEIGNSVHPGTVKKLREKGVPLIPHRALRMTGADYDRFDLLVGMDSANIRNMERICGGDLEGKMIRILDWTDSPRDVADPWYTGDFEATYKDVLEGCRAILDRITDKRET